ncbi:MAG: hypothetical protein GXY85_02075 [Candidatus Brocadiaceae bacterium]|nr:hypothetical protein [Candidatus Brocadiaceae bacterium]
MSKTRPDGGGAPSPGAWLVAAARAHRGLTFGLVVLGAAAVGLAVTTFWPGRGAQATRVLTRVAAALRDGDADAAMAHVAPGFSMEHLSRQDLHDALRSVLRDRPFVKVGLSVREVEAFQGAVHATVHATARLDMHGYAWVSRSEWLVTLSETDGRWLISGIPAVHVAGRGPVDLAGLLRSR